MDLWNSVPLDGHAKLTSVDIMNINRKMWNPIFQKCLFHLFPITLMLSEFSPQWKQICFDRNRHSSSREDSS